MRPDILYHAAHLFHEVFTGAADEGGAWAWIGLIFGVIAGLALTLGDGIPATEELVVLAILLVGIAGVIGAFAGCLAKLVYDQVQGTPPRGK